MAKTESPELIAEHHDNNEQESDIHNQVVNDNHNGHSDSGTEDVFSSLLNNNIGDHPRIGFYDAFHFDLPKIFIDDGFYFYWNADAMEEAGIFTEYHHQIVLKSSLEKELKTVESQPGYHAHPKAPALDLSITSLVCFELIGAILLFIAFKFVAGKYKKNPGKAPSGVANLLETVFVYIRDEVVRPNVGGDHIANRLLPYFISLFFFILVMNLFGLIPGGHAATGNISVTAGLAITAFIVINLTAMKEIGVGNWFKHLLGGAPWWLFPIMVPIEIISMFVKPFALTVRLFANMTAGHVVILSLIGLIFFFKTIFVSPVSVGFALFIYTLELLVAFIQAYVFTILTAVFVGLAIGDHSHHDEEHAASH